MNDLLLRWADPVELDWVNEQYRSIGFQPSEPGVRQLIAMSGETPAGLGRLVSVSTGAFELGGIVVFPEFRGRSIARSLVDHLIHAAPASDLYCLPFEHLKPFYVGMGFRPVASFEPVPDVVTEKLRWCEDRYPDGVTLLVRHSTDPR